MEPIEIRITAPGKTTLGLRDIWERRELLYFLAWRDVKVRYKNATLGVVWAILQPMGIMWICSLLFRQRWGSESISYPYPLFVLSGMLIWGIFQSSVTRSTETLTQQNNLLKKAYFPRIIIPGSVMLVALFDFIMSMIAFLIYRAYVGHLPSWNSLVYIPLSLIPVCMFSIGMACFMSALTIRYRDFQYTIAFLMQLLFFGSQIIYPLQSIDIPWLRDLLALNPLNASMDIFRLSLANEITDWSRTITGLFSGLCWMILGIYYFRKNEIFFADLT